MKICTYKLCTTPVNEQVFGSNKLEPDGLSRICKDCKRKADAMYRASDKGKTTKKRNSTSDTAKQYRKEYYAREEVKLRVKDYKSKEEYKKQQREYASREDRKIKQKIFQASDKYKNTKAAYLQTQKAKESKKLSDGKRRANKEQGTGILDATYIESLKKIQNNKCYHCGKELDFANTKSVHLDHYIPLDKGGLHCISNFVWSCSYCNISKRNKVPTKPLVFDIINMLNSK